jgi:chlorite dismutase
MPQDGRQFVKFSFFKVENQWRRLPDDVRDAGKQELVAVVDEFTDRMMIRSYSLVGLRGDADFVLWQAADTLDPVHQLGSRILSTNLGRHLAQPYSYLALTRRSIYLKGHAHSGQERLKVQPRGSKYLFVYPFVKTRPWYALSKEERQAMMNEHFAIGHKYPSIKINTTYSYGLDDQEFVLAFEGDDVGEFLDLVMELRESKASQYTLRDTPSFTCVAMDLREALDAAGA